MLFGIGTSIIGPDRLVPGRSLENVPAIGLPAPDFELNDVNGNKVRLSDLGGKVVLLNFWATWCLPCRSEMPVLDAFYLRERERFVVMAINFDEPQEIVQDFISELELSFPVLLDPGGTVQDLYRVRGYPTSYLIDQSGIVQIQHIGLLTEGQLDKYLDKVGLGQ